MKFVQISTTKFAWKLLCKKTKLAMREVLGWVSTLHLHGWPQWRLWLLSPPSRVTHTGTLPIYHTRIYDSLGIVFFFWPMGNIYSWYSEDQWKDWLKMATKGYPCFSQSWWFHLVTANIYHQPRKKQPIVADQDRTIHSPWLVFAGLCCRQTVVKSSIWYCRIYTIII